MIGEARVLGSGNKIPDVRGILLAHVLPGDITIQLVPYPML